MSYLSLRCYGFRFCMALFHVLYIRYALQTLHRNNCLGPYISLRFFLPLPLFSITTHTRNLFYCLSHKPLFCPMFVNMPSTPLCMLVFFERCRYSPIYLRKYFIHFYRISLYTICSCLYSVRRFSYPVYYRSMRTSYK